MKKEDFHQQESLGCSWMFQQDNNPKHTPEVLKEWISYSRIEVMEWSSQSPDLNLTENMWTVKTAMTYMCLQVDVTFDHFGLKLKQFR